MEKPWFVAVEIIRADSGEAWKKYLAFLKLGHIKELITLDAVLAPNVIKEFLDEDWNRNVQQDFLTGYFTDLEYLISRTSEVPNVQILSAI